MNEKLKRKGNFAQVLYESLFSLNAGFALIFTVLTYAYDFGPPTVSAYYFLLIARSASARTVLYPVSGLATFALVPLLYLHVRQAEWWG